MKSIFTINLAIMKNMECSIIKVLASFIDLKWVHRLVMALFRFYLFEHVGKRSKKRILLEAPLLALHLP